MIIELPMSNQWDVTFRNTLPTDEEYGAEGGDLPASSEPRTGAAPQRTGAASQQTDKRAVA